MDVEQPGQPSGQPLVRRRRGRPRGSKKKRLSGPLQSDTPSRLHKKSQATQVITEVLQEHSGNQTHVINQTFPDTQSHHEPEIREVSKEMYRRVLDLVTNTEEDDARQWQVSQAIFEGAMLQLDAERRGMAITYAELMPVREDGVHALREVAMRGQTPWPHNFESRVFLGSTTLAGTSAMLQRLQTWDNLTDEERLQVDIDEFERSAAACPVIRGGRIAGVLIISSTRAGFFTDKIACQSVVEYAQLMSLGLCEKLFYAPTLLKLRPMPSLRWQRTEIDHSYLPRIINFARKHTVSRQEAERRVVLELEYEFEVRGRERNDDQAPVSYFAPYTSHTSSDALLQ